MLNQVEYYKDKNVREHIAEYCGSSSETPGEFTAEYMVGYGEALLWEGRQEAFISAPKDGFDLLLDKGLDIFRSNWDRTSTLGVLDIEYFNLDFPGEVYLNPERTFELLEPVRFSVRRQLERFKIPYIEIMTGQGYHFSTRVKRNSEADAKLISIGKVGDSAAGKYAHPTGRRHRYVSLQHGASFDGMGRVIEYLTNCILRDARTQSTIPIVTTDVSIGAGSRGREAISIDLSMYGDPIYMRDIRCPFSTHQKHKVMRWKVGEEIANNIPVQICVPTAGLSLSELITMRRNFTKSAEWASKCGSMKIPSADVPFLSLIEEYSSSRLMELHREFDSAEHDHWTVWHKTYDRFDLNIIPPCVSYALKKPNPNLLMPTNIQTLTRTLLFLGWSPKHIAGLIRSKFERDYGWEGGWTKYDATMRADFYVRLFFGQIGTGLDQLLDHNCVSHQQKGYCIKPWCGYSLANYK